MHLGKTSFACLLAAVACSGAGDDRQDEPATGSSNQMGPTEPIPEDNPKPPEPVLTAAGDMTWNDCNETSVFYEVLEAVLNGRNLNEFDCSWEFDDGETSSSCAGDHLFAMGGLHTATLRVRDPVSGIVSAPIEVTEEVFAPIELELMVETPDCGLSFDYETTFNGGRAGRGFFHLSISPPEQVITTDYAMMRSGTIELAAAGTYALTINYEEEHPVGPICSATLSRFVTVTECEEPPPPDDCPPDDGTPPPAK